MQLLQRYIAKVQKNCPQHGFCQCHWTRQQQAWSQCSSCQTMPLAAAARHCLDTQDCPEQGSQHSQGIWDCNVLVSPAYFFSMFCVSQSASQHSPTLSSVAAVIVSDHAAQLLQQAGQSTPAEQQSRRGTTAPEPGLC